MKNLKLILIAAFSLALMAISCKKEKTVAPAATVTPTAPATLSLSVVEVSDQSPSFVSPNFRVMDAAGNVDSTGTLSLNATVLSTSYPTGYYCSITSITSVILSRVISNTSFYRVEVYSGTTLIRKFKITNSSVLDEGALGSVNICNYSPHKVIIAL